MKTSLLAQTFITAIICLLSFPCSASSANGMVTLVIFYYAAISVAASYPVVILMCYFRIFQHGTALFAHASIALVSASAIPFLSSGDVRESKNMVLVVAAALILFLIAIAPSITQYLYFRRKRRIAYKKSLGDPTFAQALESSPAKGNFPSET